MNVSLEMKKLKRTGFYPAFLFGAVLAAAIPILQTAFREEYFTNQLLPGLEILLGANWQMLAMLNVFFLVIGACMMYHIEFADRAIQKMESLPLSAGRVFAAKCFILLGALLFVILIEAVSIAFCTIHWFSAGQNFVQELFQIFGFEWILMVPAVILMMMVASLCRNMWISLGIGVICIFTVTILPHENLILSFFPFSLPFQSLPDAHDSLHVSSYLAASCTETALFGILEALIIRVRRNCA